LRCRIAYWMMKTHLKQIDPTLHELGNLNTASYPKPDASRDRTYSFKICMTEQERKAPAQPNSDAPEQNLSGKAPTLPNFTSPSLSSDHNVANQALEIKPLEEIQTDVAASDAELEQILGQIQDLYLEGPIVDGWLESYPSEESPEPVISRGLDERQTDEVGSFEPGKITGESPCVGYRLCGLDASGNTWSHPCPPDQLPDVSIAIARYHKLQQLLSRKQYIECRLNKRV